MGYRNHIINNLNCVEEIRLNYSREAKTFYVYDSPTITQWFLNLFRKNKKTTRRFDYLWYFRIPFSRIEEFMTDFSQSTWYNKEKQMVYDKPNVVIRYTSGTTDVYRFDTDREAMNFVSNIKSYIRKKKLKFYNFN